MSSSTPRSILQRITEYLVFRPGSPPYPNYPRKTGATSGGYRSPSPGSQKPVYIPTREMDRDLFNTQYYTRNVRKNLPSQPNPTMRADWFVLPQAVDEGEGRASKGRRNPAVEKYDPTLTRSAMTTSFVAMREEVKKWQPDHLPHPWWMAAKQKSAVEACKEKAKLGAYPEPLGVPRKSLGIARYANEW